MNDTDSFDSDKHKKINDTVFYSLLILMGVSFVGLIVVAVFLFLGISIVEEPDNECNNRNFGIEYKREYYPPYTSAV